MTIKVLNEYFDEIPYRPCQLSYNCLISLGFINYNDSISNLGELVHNLQSCEVELALLVLAGAFFGVLDSCIKIAAILSLPKYSNLFVKI